MSHPSHSHPTSPLLSLLNWELFSEEPETRQLTPLGKIYEDQFVSVTRDLVERADKSRFAHIRVCVTSAIDDVGGVAVVPLFQNRLLMNWIYRVPTRRWHLELPRGMNHSGQSLEATVGTELEEEMGITQAEIIPLGQIWADTGLIGHSVRVYGALIHSPPNPGAAAEMEGIARIVEIPLTRISGLISDGDINDGITMSSLVLAEACGFLRCRENSRDATS